ncbi:MAG: DUF1269 domain-containing protein [Propionibacteriaceae bacterium]|nr:DUF1269 domain-containing protein [Propionibacteriaceae bacterium]
MSELIILGYDDDATAEKAYNKVLELNRDFIVALNGLAMVRMDEKGRKHIETPGSLVAASTTSGALWGMILGVLFLIPGLGLLFGGAMGALSGVAGKAGVNRAFKAKVDGMLEEGKSAVVVMASKVTEDKFAAAMGEFGGTILKTSLSDADEKELEDELSAE